MQVDGAVGAAVGVVGGFAADDDARRGGAAVGVDAVEERAAGDFDEHTGGRGPWADFCAHAAQGIARAAAAGVGGGGAGAAGLEDQQLTGWEADRGGGAVLHYARPAVSCLCTGIAQGK